MADSYYYQANGETVGPLAPSALKQLANEGVIVAATPVRKGEQGDWYQAGTISGLIPPKPAGAGASHGFDSDAAERVRQTFQKAEEHADKVAAKLWFLDLKFGRFFTPKLVVALWAIYLCLVVILFLGGAVHCLLTLNALYALGLIVVQFISLLFAVISARVILEAILVIFRIAEHLEALRHLAEKKST